MMNAKSRSSEIFLVETLCAIIFRFGKDRRRFTYTRIRSSIILLFNVREHTHVLSTLQPEYFFKSNIDFAEPMGLLSF